MAELEPDQERQKEKLLSLLRVLRNVPPILTGADPAEIFQKTTTTMTFPRTTTTTTLENESLSSQASSPEQHLVDLSLPRRVILKTRSVHACGRVPSWRRCPHRNAACRRNAACHRNVSLLMSVGCRVSAGCPRSRDRLPNRRHAHEIAKRNPIQP